MSTFVIEGGRKLKGSIDVTSGKNAPVALLMGALAVRGSVTLMNMTHVEEVERVIELLKSIGVLVSWKDAHTVVLDTSGALHLDTIDKEACRKMRISLLFFGALATREKKYRVYKSGGCKLGARTIRPHTLALEKFGVSVESKNGWYEVENHALKAAEVVMYESGDTATENAILAAVLAPGKTTITFASANYMVQDLCYFLASAGAKIEGIGSTTLTITGVKHLKNSVRYTVTPDPVDAMAWISLAVTTKSPITVKNCPLPFLELELEKLSVMGQKFTMSKKRKAGNGKTPVADITMVPSDLQALPDKLYGRPFPGLNIDNVPLFVPLLTQAKGQTLVHDWCYENRTIYFLELQKFGAQIMMLDPHRALITGKTPLIGNELMCPPAIRPAMAILIAMIAAKGRSVFRNCYPLERAYDGLVERLQGLGVKISKIKSP